MGQLFKVQKLKPYYTMNRVTCEWLNELGKLSVVCIKRSISLIHNELWKIYPNKNIGKKKEQLTNA